MEFTPTRHGYKDLRYVNELYDAALLGHDIFSNFHQRYNKPKPPLYDKQMKFIYDILTSIRVKMDDILQRQPLAAQLSFHDSINLLILITYMFKTCQIIRYYSDVLKGDDNIPQLIDGLELADESSSSRPSFEFSHNHVNKRNDLLYLKRDNFQSPPLPVDGNVTVSSETLSMLTNYARFTSGRIISNFVFLCRKMTSYSKTSNVFALTLSVKNCVIATFFFIPYSDILRSCCN